MPYITRKDKRRVKETGSPTNAGELNFMITGLVQEYLISTEIKYQRFNDIMAVLEVIKLNIMIPQHSANDMLQELDNIQTLHIKIHKLTQEYERKPSLDPRQNVYDVIGALEGAKMELYRRKISLYEDIKLKENGDVYYKGDN